MTPEQKVAQINRLVSAAKALLSLQVGVAVGAQRIDRLLNWLGQEFVAEHKVFGMFLQEIPLSIPLGNSRLLWNPSAMLETDKVLSKIESKYREHLLNEAALIIKKYG